MDIGATSKGGKQQHIAGKPTASPKEKAVQDIVNTIHQKFNDGVAKHQHDPLHLKYSSTDPEVEKIIEEVPFFNAMKDIEQRLMKLGVDVLGEKGYGEASGLSSHISKIYTFTIKFPS